MSRFMPYHVMTEAEEREWRASIPHWKLAGYRLNCGHRVWTNTQFRATGDCRLYCATCQSWEWATCEFPASGTWGHFHLPDERVERLITERLAA